MINEQTQHETTHAKELQPSFFTYWTHDLRVPEVTVFALASLLDDEDTLLMTIRENLTDQRTLRAACELAEVDAEGSVSELQSSGCPSCIQRACSRSECSTLGIERGPAT